MVMTAATSLAQSPAGTAITYQGHLKEGGAPVNGTYDFLFSLLNDPVGGSLIGQQVHAANVPVTEGLFTVTLNANGEFGPDAFNGEGRWLQIGVKPAGSPLNMENLAPRQPITAAPYALHARGLSTTDVPVSSNCCVAHAGASCNDAACQSTVCAVDPFCCDVGWDEICADEAQALCGNNCLVGATQNVGIGTANPSHPLTVVTESGQFGMTHSDGTHDITTFVGPFGNGNGGWIGTQSNFPLHFYTADSDARMTIATNGNVGIGTSAPGVPLDVNGTARVKVLEVTGGSDVAEPYLIAPAAEVQPQPGMVVAIHPERLGQLRVASKSYDRTAAGIISGANGIHPGLVLTQSGSVADGTLPVASMGRVWCWADADAGGAVAAGDLLTSSDTPGHAMKVTDAARSQGAVIGKAMSALERGRGLVLVLVALQ